MLDGEYEIDFRASAWLVIEGLQKTLASYAILEVHKSLDAKHPINALELRLSRKGAVFRSFRILFDAERMLVRWTEQFHLTIVAMTDSDNELRVVLRSAEGKAITLIALGDYLFCENDEFEWARYGWKKIPLPRGAEDIVSKFEIVLPAQYRMVLEDSFNPVHERLLPCNGHGSIFEVNERLRGTEYKQWPIYLIAFATEGCGDYFAFDTRTFPYRIYYIDPIGTAAESMASCEEEGFVFESFDEWYAREIETE
jgi:hypothetical protein